MSAARRIGLFALLAGAVAACQDKAAQPPVGPAVTIADSADQIALKVTIILTDAGVARGTLYADTAFILRDASKFEFRNARVEFNTRQGTKNGTMTGKRATWDASQGIMEGFGDVVITTIDGKKLESPQLKFHRGLNEVSSDTTFRYSDGSRVQEGFGLRTDPQLTRIQVLGRARGRAGPVPVPER